MRIHPHVIAWSARIRSEEIRHRDVVQLPVAHDQLPAYAFYDLSVAGVEISGCGHKSPRHCAAQLSGHLNKDGLRSFACRLDCGYDTGSSAACYNNIS
ncbi:hypothetical protein SDC9_165014 [bioreactor metagenome]|uniref:Uncharacterized protein n=1 Tax=bioreactor metagenome TaxID=1076179 RepID=A0A645FVT5_9ZZZZ